MKALIQRVSQAAITVKENHYAKKIGPGLVIFLGVGNMDTAQNASKLAEKVAQLRIFSNQEGKFDHSLLDIKGEALVISQFTLYGDASKGRRPDFTQAASPQTAQELYKAFLDSLRTAGVAKVEEGLFGAHMEIALINDGPVTLLLEN